MNLSRDLDTEIGPEGTRISEGQRVKIAIARALVKKPALMIFDDITSTLDRKSEKVIQETL